MVRVNGGDSPALMLIRWVGSLPYTICEIVCPPHIELRRVQELLIDGNLGVVYLQEGEDVLHRLTFG
jgi:hypothetical protein